MDSEGNQIWTRTVGGNFSVSGYSITVDLKSNVNTTGYYSDTIDFHTEVMTHFLATASKTQEVFISKPNPNGKFVWAKRLVDRQRRLAGASP
jgi:hypothetical protein